MYDCWALAAVTTLPVAGVPSVVIQTSVPSEGLAVVSLGSDDQSSLSASLWSLCSSPKYIVESVSLSSEGRWYGSVCPSVILQVIAHTMARVLHGIRGERDMGHPIC